ncbi:MAG: hypothetical protein K8H84_10555 [Sulfuricella denitrificans]|nr:hypothetical protein [Sulfuricella denitrificans]
MLSTGAEIVMAHDHEHSHETPGPDRLTLNNGHKWATDDNLRLGMSRIRDALAVELPAIRDRKFTDEQYRSLAQKTNDQIAFMAQNCKLDRDADAMLHLVLAEIIDGADVMAKQGGRKKHPGAEKVIHALDNYGAYFDHPGWHGVKLPH